MRLLILFSPEDRALKDRLAQHLEVLARFGGIDLWSVDQIRAGSDWRKEFDRALEQADVALILLSAAILAADDFHDVEVPKLCQRRKQDVLRIVPVLMRSCLWESVPFLVGLAMLPAGRRPVASFEGDALDHVLVEIAKEVVSRADAPPSFVDAACVRAAAPPRVRPVSDWQGGALPLGHALYVERGVDERVLERARLLGQTVVVKGPPQTGKTSLFFRYCKACNDAGKRVALVDFQKVLAKADLTSHSVVLTRLAQAIAKGLQLPSPSVPIENQLDMSSFLEETVLSAVQEPIVLALDQVDRVLMQTYQDDFFGMLRGWHDDRVSPTAHEGYARLDLALVIRVEPFMLIGDGNLTSPFNVGMPWMDVGCFTKVECGDLNVRYRTGLSGFEVDTLFELLGGHLDLTHLAHQHLLGGTRFDELVRTAHEHGSPFWGHLEALRDQLQRTPTLLPVFKRVLANRTLATDAEHCKRLVSAGLVRVEGGRYVPACELYARYFGKSA